MSNLLKIGVSASFFHRDPTRPLFKNKTLLVLEESLAHWVQSAGTLCILVPTVGSDSPVSLKELVSELDGLVLQGGADVSPSAYGEKEIRPEWAGDPIRDEYEIKLLRECLAQDKPVLGVCRGAQLINVAFGGTLYQDINTQVENSFLHRNWEVYDQNVHSIAFEPGGLLEKLYPSFKSRQVSSIHHQAVKDLGKDLIVEARSSDDGIIEAIRHLGSNYVVGVQWHPEFHCPKKAVLLGARPLLDDFIREARAHRTSRSKLP